LAYPRVIPPTYAVCEIAPLLYECIPKGRRKTRIVVEGLAANSWARDIQGVLGIQVGQYLLLWLAIAPTVLSEGEDKLIWKWSTGGIYTAKSTYRATFLGSKCCAA